MATTASRDAYLRIGLEILASDGYGALKQSELCRRMGVTTGSFYHFFRNWADYTSALPDYWFTTHTQSHLGPLLAEPDADVALDALISYGLMLPHGAEGAIRSWSSADPAVRRVVEVADQLRYDVVHNIVGRVLDPEAGARYAHWALLIIIGYEQTTLSVDLDTLRWTAAQWVESISRERASVSTERTAAGVPTERTAAG